MANKLPKTHINNAARRSRVGHQSRLYKFLKWKSDQIFAQQITNGWWNMFPKYTDEFHNLLAGDSGLDLATNAGAGWPVG